MLTPGTIMRGIDERRKCVGGDDLAASRALQELYNIMSDPLILDKDGDMDKRFVQASEVAMTIFRKATGSLEKIEQATKAIGSIKAKPDEGENNNARLIPRGQFWSSDRGRAVSREDILEWCTATYDIAEGDRFWVAPKAWVGVAKVPTATGPAWMLTAYRDGKCVSSAQTDNAFELMIFLDTEAAQLNG
jgi:hypothetical protein